MKFYATIHRIMVANSVEIEAESQAEAEQKAEEIADGGYGWSPNGGWDEILQEVMQVEPSNEQLEEVE